MLIERDIWTTVSPEVLAPSCSKSPCDKENDIRVNDFLQTSNRRIYAADDACLEHKFTHTADASGRIVVQNAPFLGRQRLSALHSLVHLDDRRPLCGGDDQEDHPGHGRRDLTHPVEGLTNYADLFTRLERAKDAIKVFCEVADVEP